MAFANDWNTLSKGNKKARLEARIAVAIERLADLPGPPTQWQKAKVLDALDATTRGLFDVAATHLDQVFAETPADHPWSHPDTNLADFEAVTIESLRAELDRLRSRPVQDPPDYL